MPDASLPAGDQFDITERSSSLRASKLRASKIVAKGSKGAVGQLPPASVLPSDLGGALRSLDDASFAELLTGVLQEARRRNTAIPIYASGGNLPDLKAENFAPRKTTPKFVETGSCLKQGQLNAIRAAFSAGIKISAIARQFGIPQSTVKQAIASRL